MKLIRKILFPIVPIYYLVTWLRNKLYDWGVKSSKSYDFPVICVGNLSVGGTGKTPMIEYLIQLLNADYKLATLSRGYGRKTKGFLLANKKNASAESLGDEPYQFYNKFKDEVLISVDENRRKGVDSLLQFNNKPDIVLLDDAYQHRKVKAGFNILLTTYINPFFKDIVLPTGDLREPRVGAKRADLIVVTKCPIDLSEAQKKRFISAIAPRDTQQVYFSSISYSEVVFSKTDKKNIKDLVGFTLVTGIANPKPLTNYLSAQHLEFDHLNYKDHHHFTEKEIAELETKNLIITTEKDFVRLKQYDSLAGKLYYLPITVSLDDPGQFNAQIKTFIKSF